MAVRWEMLHEKFGIRERGHHSCLKRSGLSLQPSTSAFSSLVSPPPMVVSTSDTVVAVIGDLAFSTVLFLTVAVGTSNPQGSLMSAMLDVD